MGKYKLTSDSYSELPNHPDQIGQYLGINCTFDKHTAIGGMHTFSMCANPFGDEFLGYAGPLDYGRIDLWTSPDLTSWNWCERNPIISYPGARWPSIITNNQSLYMALRAQYHSSNNFLTSIEGSIPESKVLFPLNRLRRAFAGHRPTSIVLMRSHDGIHFERICDLVPEGSHSHKFNQNPFLFSNPNTGNFGLVYYSGGGGVWEIRMKIAQSIIDLPEATDFTLLRSTTTLAAPAIFYHEPQKTFYLLTEAKKPSEETWIVKAYKYNKLSPNEKPRDSFVLFNDDVACPFPHVIDNTLYLFVSKRIRAGAYPKWEGQIHKFQLE